MASDDEGAGLVVTLDGSRPPLPPSVDGASHVVYADARARGTWPVLAQLDVPLTDLPRAYALRTDAAWLDRPRPLPRSRVRAVPLRAPLSP